MIGLLVVRHLFPQYRMTTSTLVSPATSVKEGHGIVQVRDKNRSIYNV